MTPFSIPQQLRELRSGLEFKDYRLLERIGSGGQGEVWSGVDRVRNRIVAVKFAESLGDDKQEIDERIFARQAKQLATLRHPYILPMLDYALEGRMRILVTPYIAGGSLAEVIRGNPLPFHESMQYVDKIAAALAYLHRNGVVHRDLKPGNVLIDLRRNIYLADFGLARIIGNATQVLHTGRGTPSYSPPEQHNFGEATYASDMFSFGILLYEIFTGSLPWRGEKTLGMQQLYSKEQLPDPRQVNPDLPPGLVKLLRQMTSPSPASRPVSIPDVMEKLHKLFNLPTLPLASETDWNADDFENIGAQELLSSNLIRWGAADGTKTLTLTKFALVDAGKNVDDPLQTDEQRFLLQASLLYGYNDQVWWQRIRDSRERLAAATELIGMESGIVSARIIQHLVDDDEISELRASITVAQAAPLLRASARLNDRVLRQQFLARMRRLLPRQEAWQIAAIDSETDTLLAGMAIDSNPTGVEAALLAGHLKSQTALAEILRVPNERLRTRALMNFLQAASSLPANLPLFTRLQILAEWVLWQVFSNPPDILRAYAAAALGVSLAFGLHTYLAYRLPDFLDSLRLTTTIEHGLFAGLLMGLGLLVPRLATERLPNQRVLPRLVAGSLTGMGLLTIAIVLYDIVMLRQYDLLELGNIGRTGMVIAGSLLVAFGQGLAGLMGSNLARALSATLFALAGLGLSWWGHITLPGAPLPILFYEYTWPASQVLISMFISSALLAIPASLPGLSPKN